MQQRKYSDARKLMADYHRVDPYNGNVAGYLAQIKDMEQSETRRLELEKTMQTGADLNAIFELLSVYSRLNLQGQLQGLAMWVLDNTNLPPAVSLELAKLCGDARRSDIAAEALRRYLRVDPINSRVWIELALAQLTMGQQNEAIASLQKAIEIGGEAARTLLRGDNRFGRFRQAPAFQSLIQQVSPFRLDLSAP
jgi:tetratricopeptide (TPR) repeat protein